MEKESADRQERTMGFQACIPTNKQSHEDGGKTGRGGVGGSHRKSNPGGDIRDVDRQEVRQGLRLGDRGRI